MQLLRDLAYLWRTQRTRTLSTLFGIAWGAASVVLLLAFGAGLQEDMERKAGNLGRHVVVVWPQKTTRAHAGLGVGRWIQLREQDIAALPELIPGLADVSPEYQGREQVQVGQRIYNPRLSGVSPAYARLRSMTPQPGGRFLNERDLLEKRCVVFLGDRIKRGLFGDARAVGRQVILKGIPFTVVGVLKPKKQDANYGGVDADRVCLPAPVFAQIFGRPYLTNFVYRARDLSCHDRVKRQVYAALGRRCRFDPEDWQALNLWDTTKEARMRETIFLAFHLILGSSGLLTLLVGAVGIGNLMFIRVRQQTREMGIQMAVGARPGRIFRAVLGESLLLVLAGGIMGLIFSWGIISLVGMTPLVETMGRPAVSWQMALGVVALLGAVGCGSGFFPARRAARLDPVAALSD